MSSLNLQFSHFDDDDILQAYYDDRVVAADKNPMLDAIDASGDYIILIPREDDIERKPALFMETVRLIKAYTAKRDSKIIVPMIWDSGTFSSSLSYVEEVSYRVTDALALDCVPAGLVMEDVVNDTLISATASSVQSPNKWVEYVMAVSVYTHLFEQDAHNSTYTHEDITAEQTTQIIDYAYSNWDEAQTATHYTGEFTSSFCTPFEVPLLLADMRNWASMGTSTEKGTTRQLRKIMKNTGYGDLGIHIDGYEYDDGNTDYRYFPDNLEVDAIQTLITDSNYDFLFGRPYGSLNFSSHMNTLHGFDPDEGSDTRFVFSQRHYTTDRGSEVSSEERTLAGIRTQMGFVSTSAHSDVDCRGTPNYLGFGRAWEQRPELILVPRVYDVHLTTLGETMLAGMIYTVMTNRNPLEHYNGWTEEQEYVLYLAYKTVTELGYLKRVNATPEARDAVVTVLQDETSNIDIEGFDLDYDYLKYTIVTQPANGTLTQTGEQFTYTPDPGFEGLDTITYTVDDGFEVSSVGTLTLNVIKVPEALIWERGKVTEVDNQNWRTVSLANNYNDMVVIATPIYSSSNPPMVPRIRNASGNSFEILAQPVNDSNEPVSTIDLEYFVVDEGTYFSDIHGIKMEAKKYLSTSTYFRRNDWDGDDGFYNNKYTTPVVLGQVMTYNDPNFSYFWTRGSNRGDSPSSTVLRTGKAVAGDTNQARADETLGYVVIEAGSGTLPGSIHYTAQLGGRTVEGMHNSPPYDYPITGVENATGVILTQAGLDNRDGSWALLYGDNYLTDQGLLTAVDEDIIRNSDRSHGAEQLAYLVFSASTDATDYLPGLPDEDMDGNGVDDLSQFAAGGDFRENRMNSIYEMQMLNGSEISHTVEFNLYRRKNLNAFGLTQQILISVDGMDVSDAICHDIIWCDITSIKLCTS
ncbi:MAG: Ig-like domain-containing protein [Verrucomicrobiota bacterium]